MSQEVISQAQEELKEVNKRIKLLKDCEKLYKDPTFKSAILDGYFKENLDKLNGLVMQAKVTGKDDTIVHRLMSEYFSLKRVYDDFLGFQDKELVNALKDSKKALEELINEEMTDKE